LDDIYQLDQQLQEVTKKCSKVEQENVALRARLREYDIELGDGNDVATDALDTEHKKDVTADTIGTQSPGPLWSGFEMPPVNSDGTTEPHQPM
jgi:hypothetical protein